MSFNYNISDYRIDELMEMFDLPTIYDTNILNSKEDVLTRNMSIEN
jgi:hypothetical protein